MKFVVLDGGSISPAYFSQPAIKYLEQHGHQVEILQNFDLQKCAAADCVWTEWVNELAFAAAASGVCKRLVLRMRGYDVWFPLDRLEWSNVDALLYESPSLRELACSRFPQLEALRDGGVQPAGIDLTRFPFRERAHGPVFALIARATSDKGYQLALEWARRHPWFSLHLTLLGGESNPRLVRYLEHAAPANVHLHGAVDTAEFLNRSIDANYLLLPSIWETLSYTVAEAMAMGIKPLIHDFPGVTRNWPADLVWRTFDDLNNVIAAPYRSHEYRDYVKTHLDAQEHSERFVGLVLNLPARVVVPTADQTTALFAEFSSAMRQGALDDAATAAAAISASDQLPSTIRGATALQLAALLYQNDRLEEARRWALLSMVGGPRQDALALLGELAVDEDVPTAHSWYAMAALQPEPRSRFVLSALVEGVDEREEQLRTPVPVEGTPPPPKYVVVIPVRNGERWIGPCIESVIAQSTIATVRVVVVDDASTDETNAVAQGWVARYPRKVNVLTQTTRVGALRNTLLGARLASTDPEDVVVVVDGDDVLLPGAIACIDHAYRTGAWMTYGSWRDTNGKLSWMGAYPTHVVENNSYRRWMWCATQPKTFKRWLSDKVREEDFKDANGEYFLTGGDAALMVPMLEMAGEHAIHIPDVIYTYNVETPDNDHKVDSAAQVRVWETLRARPSYSRLPKRP